MNHNRSSFTAFCVALLALLVLVGCAPAPTPAAPAPAATLAPAVAATTAPTTAPAYDPYGGAPAIAPTTAAAATIPAPVAATGPTLKLARVTNFGLFLTDDADRTLYAFDKDTKDSSNCVGNCLQSWPPYTVRGMPQAAQGINAALISTFVRAEGTTQAEYDGHPLYYYSGDTNPGDFKGHGVGNVWHVLSPRGSPMTNPAPVATKAP
jgi:predicted lipoprotein with Yx(FWY)xxD motif